MDSPLRPRYTSRSDFTPLGAPFAYLSTTQADTLCMLRYKGKDQGEARNAAQDPREEQRLGEGKEERKCSWCTTGQDSLQTRQSSAHRMTPNAFVSPGQIDRTVQEITRQKPKTFYFLQTNSLIVRLFLSDMQLHLHIRSIQSQRPRLSGSAKQHLKIAQLNCSTLTPYCPVVLTAHSFWSVPVYLLPRTLSVLYYKCRTPHYI